MLRRLYDWTLGLAGHRHALAALGTVSFLESSIFPIPPDAMLVPMVLARPDRAWRIALVCTVTSVLGGFAGYALGFFLYETVGRLIVESYGYQAAFLRFQLEFDEWGTWVILVKGLTPIPYKLVTIAAGVAKFDLLAFSLASIATRGGRFFLVAALLKYFGPSIRHFIKSYMTWVATAFLVALVGGFVVLRWL
ncbi:MAG: DedA family protein [Alphaproteobacteria bacterium]|nr:DedA family protein [Alphaproteobacteria bacterium]